MIFFKRNTNSFSLSLDLRDMFYTCTRQNSHEQVLTHIMLCRTSFLSYDRSPRDSMYLQLVRDKAKIAKRNLRPLSQPTNPNNRLKKKN